MDEQTDFSRIVSFTDGVFAIAITLLVLSFASPDKGGDTAQAILDQWPQLLAYFLSFVVVGRMWLAHHRFFFTLERFDSRLIALNFLYLSFVCLIPYTTNVLGDHGGETVAPVLYAIVLSLAVVANWLMIRYTLAHDHVRRELRPRTARLASAGTLLIPAVFVASIPVAFVSPNGAEWMWALIALQGLMGRGRTEATSS
jgi:uncharacterized membrane protein